MALEWSKVAIAIAAKAARKKFASIQPSLVFSDRYRIAGVG
jgi:hypothetical protein